MRKLIAPSTPPTDVDWQRLTVLVGRLAAAAPEHVDDITWLLNFIEALATPHSEDA